jgi:hypothetical protein
MIKLNKYVQKRKDACLCIVFKINLEGMWNKFKLNLARRTLQDFRPFLDPPIFTRLQSMLAKV